MANCVPISIQHIRLEEELPVDFENGSYYLVAWWRSIPLGDLYTDFQSDEVSDVTIKEKLFEAILPAFRFYVKDEEKITDCRKEFIEDKQEKFILLMDEVFKQYLIGMSRITNTVSVIICTKNRSESLEKCLAGFSRQVIAPNEVIVIDNAPVDDSTKDVVAKYPSITYFREERAGLDIARNTGARLAKSSIIAYIDDDVMLHPLWTKRIIEIFEDSNIDAMTGLVIASELETESQQIFEKHWSFNRGYSEKIYATEFINPANKSAPRVWEIGAGANMAFRKEVLHTVKYFDERLDVGAAGCNGDSEIWYRLLYSGFIIKYCPLAVVYHEHRKDIKALKKQMFGYMRGHVAAALIQNKFNPAAGYKRYVYFDLIIHYIRLLKNGFPGYIFRYQTLPEEIRGVISGILFYMEKKEFKGLSADEMRN